MWVQCGIAATGAVGVLSFALAALLSWLAPAQTPLYAEVAQTRTYWFVDMWHWYEWLGLIAPLFVLVALWWREREDGNRATRLLAEMTIAAGSTAVAVAVVFAQESARTYMVARMQPLRIYQTIYILMLVALGCGAGRASSGAKRVALGGTLLRIRWRDARGAAADFSKFGAS